MGSIEGKIQQAGGRILSSGCLKSCLRSKASREPLHESRLVNHDPIWTSDFWQRPSLQDSRRSHRGRALAQAKYMQALAPWAPMHIATALSYYLDEKASWWT